MIGYNRASADIVDRFITDGIDVVHLAYAQFKSTLVQDILSRSASQGDPG